MLREVVDEMIVRIVFVLMSNYQKRGTDSVLKWFSLPPIQPSISVADEAITNCLCHHSVFLAHHAAE